MNLLALPSPRLPRLRRQDSSRPAQLGQLAAGAGSRTSRLIPLVLALVVALAGTSAAGASAAEPARPTQAEEAGKDIHTDADADTDISIEIEAPHGVEDSSNLGDADEPDAGTSTTYAVEPAALIGVVRAQDPTVPVGNSTITLLDAATHAPVAQGSIGSAGAYEVAVDAGEYLLQVDPVAGANARTVYHPGVIDPARAETITLASGEVRDVGALTLPLDRVIAGTVTVSGTARTGSTLTARSSGYTPSTAVLSHQWYRGSAAIQGATGSSYTLVAGDVSRQISVSVTASAPETDSVSWSSTSRQAAAGTLTPGKPAVSGTARVGVRLTANTGTWTARTTFSYQWFADGRAISGATSSRYTVRAGDLDRRITVRVTGSLAGYTSVSATSARTKTVVRGVFAEKPRPVITGTAQQGTRLRVRTGTWAPNPQLSYQWRVNGIAVRGATKNSFMVRSSDHGKRITVTVTAKRNGYTTTSRTSAQTARVAVPFRSAPAPTISGTARVGNTLTARTAAWSPKATLRYQWYAAGTAIPGATSSKLTLRPAQHNQRITVRVTGSRTTYVTRHRTSTATARVAAPGPTLRGDGMYRVGTDIKPGTYVASSGASCYWERRDRAGSSFAGILANDFNPKGRVIVTIRPGDKYFSTSRCGNWTRLMPNNARSTTFSDGTHAVGNHIRPGTYRTTGGKGCYWERTSAFTGDFGAIIENEYTSGRSRQVVTVRSGEGFTSQRCGTWTRIGP